MAADAGPWEKLSPRQIEVLRLIAQGNDRHGIADKLGIAAGTAAMHVERIRNQLGVYTQAQAVHKAHVLGFLTTKDSVY